ncbi:uncharacterized protein MONOS_13647 [Monocercomonoides exilis]|uniref:uncharacterized protein n=1 Tax=Monocercomonoides exilis TaxID=2049356 RepID=UPI00355A5450|nr:hypothetical protein MONOS_13647 [Monocercomonoides exilis]|eukprot:MONOS_13647.1-p1 / transcript=MONOS_13647.1 / gene=MONOS_13647 / organism=Monocercomonoides_exilis_PA203 / gene_product=unspecified product / transcript_product=unspecified product / location=Mono_scaffold00858:1103-3818(+) / protein_length=854 / sequence_SO=supercontig / SO=protein_coding / is_pseudo=false
MHQLLSHKSELHETNHQELENAHVPKKFNQEIINCSTISQEEIPMIKTVTAQRPSHNLQFDAIHSEIVPILSKTLLQEHIEPSDHSAFNANENKGIHKNGSTFSSSQKDDRLSSSSSFDLKSFDDPKIQSAENKEENSLQLQNCHDSSRKSSNEMVSSSPSLNSTPLSQSNRVETIHNENGGNSYLHTNISQDHLQSKLEVSVPSTSSDFKAFLKSYSLQFPSDNSSQSSNASFFPQRLPPSQLPFFKAIQTQTNSLLPTSDDSPSFPSSSIFSKSLSSISRNKEKKPIQPNTTKRRKIDDSDDENAERENERIIEKNQETDKTSGQNGDSDDEKTEKEEEEAKEIPEIFSDNLLSDDEIVSLPQDYREEETDDESRKASLRESERRGSERLAYVMYHPLDEDEDEDDSDSIEVLNANENDANAQVELAETLKENKTAKESLTSQKDATSVGSAQSMKEEQDDDAAGLNNHSFSPTAKKLKIKKISPHNSLHKSPRKHHKKSEDQMTKAEKDQMIDKQIKKAVRARIDKSKEKDKSRKHKEEEEEEEEKKEAEEVCKERTSNAIKNSTEPLNCTEIKTDNGKKVEYKTKHEKTDENGKVNFTKNDASISAISELKNTDHITSEGFLKSNLKSTSFVKSMRHANRLIFDDYEKPSTPVMLAPKDSSAIALERPLTDELSLSVKSPSAEDNCLFFPIFTETGRIKELKAAHTIALPESLSYPSISSASISTSTSHIHSTPTANLRPIQIFHSLRTSMYSAGIIFFPPQSQQFQQLASQSSLTLYYLQEGTLNLTTTFTQLPSQNSTPTVTISSTLRPLTHLQLPPSNLCFSFQNISSENSCILQFSTWNVKDAFH